MLAQDADDGRIALGLGDLQRGMGFWRCPPSVNSHVVLPFELDGLRAGTCSAKQLHGASILTHRRKHERCDASLRMQIYGCPTTE